MELNFQKKESVWEVEFEANSDFNIHIEGVVEGNVALYQRTATSGEFALVRGSQLYPSFSKTYDLDFTGVIYPKTIKVKCATKPVSGIVTFAE